MFILDCMDAVFAFLDRHYLVFESVSFALTIFDIALILSLSIGPNSVGVDGSYKVSKDPYG